MPYSTVSNFSFDPQLASEYSSAAFVENMQLMNEALGVVKTIPTGAYSSSLGGGGEFIELPYFDNISALVSRRDLTSTVPPNDLDISGEQDRAVILRRRAGPVKFTEDVFVRGLRREEVEAEIGRQIGHMAAKEVRERMLSVSVAATTTLADSTGHTHLLNMYSESSKNLLTLANLYDTRMTLGDSYNRLTTVVCHSEAFADLVKDTIGNYKIQNVGGFTVVTGLPQAFGMKVVVVDDASLKESLSGHYAKYRTLLFGENSLGLIYHQNLRIEAERRLDFEAPYWRVLANFDYAPHMFGMKYIAGLANPDNNMVGASTSWAPAFNDHRQVLCAQLIHNCSAS